MKMFLRKHFRYFSDDGVLLQDYHIHFSETTSAFFFTAFYGKITLIFSGRPESYEKTLLITVSQFWGQPFQNVQRFEKGPQNK